MAEHKVDQVTARNQPVPGPLPSEPFEVLETHPAGAPAHRRLAHGRRRWARRLSSAMRTKRGRRVLIGLACAVVLLVGLVASGFLSSPAPSVAAPGDALGLGTQPSAPAPSTPAAKNKKRHASGSGQLVSNPVNALRSRFPDNPLNHLHGAGIHNVVITASSGEPMTVVGYLVPTGLGSSYGVVKGHPRHWAIHEQALGKGYLAAIFVQTGKDGAPITCTVSVDGKVTSSETTSGGYGRAICLG